MHLLLAFYAGPDQVMTVTSGIATVVGFLLMFWNKVVTGFCKFFGLTRKSPDPAPSQDTTKTSS
ncbi:MAG TPA: hypothetical protein VJO35_02385 [Terriglobales bacterium]|nr:hypothetical protein [Terriglobales bacterium]